MVIYHSVKFYVSIIIQLEVINIIKFYVSIIIQLEVININVRNFKFPQNMALTPFTTNLKTLGSTRNIYL